MAGIGSVLIPMFMSLMGNLRNPIIWKRRVKGHKRGRMMIYLMLGFWRKNLIRSIVHLKVISKLRILPNLKKILMITSFQCKNSSKI